MAATSSSSSSTASPSPSTPRQAAPTADSPNTILQQATAAPSHVQVEPFPNLPRRGARRRGLLDAYRDMAGAKEQSSDPKDIDSAAFDGAAYFRTMIRSMNLKDLLGVETQMKKEVRNLDSEMKTLVYQNYHKFISATVTIRAIQEQVGDVEAQMARLNEAMKRIDVCHESMEKKLRPRHEAVRELNAIARLLQQRQVLFEMPAKLRRSLQREAYATAVSYYQNTAAILRKYHDVASFQAILTECDTIMDSLGTTLLARLDDVNSSRQQRLEACDLLLKLSQPIATVRQRYLAGRERVLVEKLEHAEAQMTASDQPTSPSSQSQSPQSTQSQSTQSQSTQSQSTTDQQVVEQQKQIGLVRWISELDMAFLSAVIEIVEEYQSTFKATAADAAQLESFGKRMFAKFFAVVRVRLDKPMWRSDEVLKAVEALHRQLEQTAAFVPKSFGVSDQSTNVIYRAVGNHIDAEFARATSPIGECVARLVSEGGGGTTEAAYESVDALVTHVLAPIDNVRGFVSAEAAASSTFLAHHRRFFLDKIRTRVQHLLLLIVDIAADYFPRPNSDADPVHAVPSTQSVLLLAKALLLLAGNGLDSVQKRLTHLAPADAQATLSSSEEAARLKTHARYALAFFARLEGDRLAKLVRSPIESADWLGAHNKAPRSVRANVRHLVDMLTETRSRVAQLFPITAALSSSSVSAAASSSTPASAAAARSLARAQVDLLFSSKKLNNPALIEFDANSIVTAVTNIVVKTFLECVRQQTFCKNAFQQFQVDIYYLRVYLQNFVADNALLDAMLNLVLQSVADRCPEPVALPQKTIEKIARQEYEKSTSPHESS